VILNVHILQRQMLEMIQLAQYGVFKMLIQL